MDRILYILIDWNYHRTRTNACIHKWLWASKIVALAASAASRVPGSTQEYALINSVHFTENTTTVKNT